MKVLIVDDNDAVLAGVALLVQTESPRLELVGLARSGADALPLARAQQPHVIVLDLCLAGESGLDLLPALTKACNAAVVVLTSYSDAATRSQALARGAHAFVDKFAAGATLIAAIEDAGAHCAR